MTFTELYNLNHPNQADIVCDITKRDPNKPKKHVVYTKEESNFRDFGEDEEIYNDYEDYEDDYNLTAPVFKASNPKKFRVIARDKDISIRAARREARNSKEAMYEQSWDELLSATLAGDV